VTLRLTKHHGLGNDFLVVFHPDVPVDALPGLAERLCDRRTGLGADGLLIGESDPEFSAQMVLYNADGSRAEMSGNGIRCFAQALALRRGDLGPFVIRSDAGPRRVEMIETADPRTLHATVEMGDVTELDEPSGWGALGTDPGRPVANLSLGNPHAVVPVDDLMVVDLAALGAKVPDVNLEIITPGPDADTITMRVHERGAGITMACGTGACAAAFAARRWGLAEPADGKLVVVMDGGRATVGFDRERSRAVTLTGPSTFVASIETPA
jgi:diaminopimelate epimerase